MMPFKATVSKFKMIRNATLFKDIITQKSQNRYMSYFKSKTAFQISIAFSGIMVMASMLSTKRTICTRTFQRWLGMVLFWLSNIYFIIEWFSLVDLY